jgi:uncharacterized DUF497 family protein
MHPEQAEEFDWDEYTVEKLAGKSPPITPHEAEEVYFNDPVWRPNKKNRAGDWKMIGRTDGGRLLTLFLRTLPDRRAIRIITGYEATAGDQTEYEKERQ